MKRLFTLAITAFSLLLLITSAHAQAPGLLWETSIGNAGYDYEARIRQLADSSFVLLGSCSNNGNGVTGHHGGGADAEWIRMNKQGEVISQKVYGGPGADYAADIIPAGNNGSFLLCYTNAPGGDVSSTHGNYDFWLVRTDNSGVIQWQKTYGGSGADIPSAGFYTSDGGLVMVGYTSSPNNGDVTGKHDTTDVWVVKVDSLGNLQWQKTLGGSWLEFGRDIIQTADGGYALTGNVGSGDGDITTGLWGWYDIWVVKLDAAGNLVWQDTYGGTDWDAGWGIVQTADGGYAVLGQSYSADGNVSGGHGQGDYYLLKLTATGGVQWSKMFGGTGDEYPQSLALLPDGGFLLCGHSESADGNVSGNRGGNDVWVMEASPAGVLRWQKSLGTPGDDYGLDCIGLLDGGVAVTGDVLSDGGDVTNWYGQYDMWVVRLARGLGVDAAGVTDVAVKVYPTVTKGNVTVELPDELANAAMSIINGLGQVMTVRTGSGVRRNLDLRSLPVGVYYLNVAGAGSSTVVKE